MKAPSWEYEGEWRFIEYPGKPGLRVFPEKALTGIVLGAAMDQATQGFIRSIVAERLSPLPIYRAVLDPIHYRLDVEPVR